jgi:hypothetical protein
MQNDLWRRSPPLLLTSKASKATMMPSMQATTTLVSLSGVG